MGQSPSKIQEDGMFHAICMQGGRNFERWHTGERAKFMCNGSRAEMLCSFADLANLLSLTAACEANSMLYCLS